MLSDAISVVTGSLVAAAVIPGTLELTLLTVGGVLPPRPATLMPSGPRSPLRFCFVVPAHDEAEGISACVQSLRRCEAGPDVMDMVVVADNCADDTEGRAQAAGARVLVRRDPQNRGKGYALAYAFEYLLLESHDVFIVVDADTRVEPNLIQALAPLFTSGADAVQCRYRASNPEESARSRLMHIAWLAFNVLRPRGREYWGWSVGILGNGFALHRKALENVPFDAGSIAEDLEYHIRFVQSGRRVRFCDATTVWSPVPPAGTGALTQRVRWEGGRFRMMREQLPSLFRGLMRGEWALLEPTMELLLLPLAFHVLLLAALILNPWTAGRILGYLGIAVVGLHVAAALYIGRSGWRDWAALAGAPLYILWKLALGKRLLRASRRDALWERTGRTNRNV